MPLQELQKIKHQKVVTNYRGRLRFGVMSGTAAGLRRRTRGRSLYARGRAAALSDLTRPRSQVGTERDEI